MARPGASKQYDQTFYDGLWGGAVKAAQLVLPAVLDAVRPRSVIDVGCGTGAWLSVVAGHGVAQLVGVDSEVSLTATQRFDAFRFVPADLAQPIPVIEHFDLAMSIEVAEHLPAISAQTFIESLTDLAPVVLFSAAFPGQGGTGHINEQWPSYWVERFRRRGFEPLEVCRPELWPDPDAPLAMKTNPLLFADRTARSDLFNRFDSPAMIDVVHPQLWAEALKLRESAAVRFDRRVRGLWRRGAEAARRVTDARE